MQALSGIYDEILYLIIAYKVPCLTTDVCYNLYLIIYA